MPAVKGEGRSDRLAYGLSTLKDDEACEGGCDIRRLAHQRVKGEWLELTGSCISSDFSIDVSQNLTKPEASNPADPPVHAPKDHLPATASFARQ